MDRSEIVRYIGLAICFGLAFMLRAELNPKPKSNSNSNSNSPGSEAPGEAK